MVQAVQEAAQAQVMVRAVQEAAQAQVMVRAVQAAAAVRAAAPEYSQETMLVSLYMQSWECYRLRLYLW